MDLSDKIITGGLGFLSLTAGFIFGRKKERAEVKKAEIDSVQKVVDIWRSLALDLKKEVDELKSVVERLSRENEHLTSEVNRLSKLSEHGKLKR